MMHFISSTFTWRSGSFFFFLNFTEHGVGAFCLLEMYRSTVCSYCKNVRQFHDIGQLISHLLSLKSPLHVLRPNAEHET